MSALFPAPCMTLGGLRVAGETGNVVRADGSVIEGLYAAGRNAVGVSSRSYLSGLAHADGFFSGRNAGRSAARRALLRAQAVRGATGRGPPDPERTATETQRHRDF